MFDSFLDQIEEKDKECYDEIFNEYKTAFRKHIKSQFMTYWTDDKIREHLENSLENDYDFKADYIDELNQKDLILDNLYGFAEFCSENIERLL